MIPQVTSAFLGWTATVQLRVVQPKAVDFAAGEDVLGVDVLDAVMQPMKPQSVGRKPEGERAWKWHEAWSTHDMGIDSVVQDQDGMQFRIQSRENWSQGGFFHYEMTEQPT